MTDIVVVDANIAVKWLVREHDSGTAEALASEWRRNSVRVVAPYVLLAETANTLHQRVKKDLLIVDAAAGLLEALTSTGIEFRHSMALYQRALAIADQLGQGAVYDSVYLALAESLDCDLWTADARFQRAARGQYANVHLLSEFEPLA